MSLLNKLEDFFIQIIRLVLLAFSVVVLAAIAVWLIGKVMPSSDSDDAHSPAIAWSKVQPDLQFVVEETGRDMDMSTTQPLLHKQLVDAQLRPAFKQADQLIRDFVAQQAQQHAHIEELNDARGLAPLHPLLQGDTAPTEQQRAALEQQAQAAVESDSTERAANAAVDAAHDAAASEAIEAAMAAAEAAAEECCFTEPVDVAQVLHDRATQVHSEYGDDAYRAYVLGAPAALELVLSNQVLAPKLHELTVSRLVDMLLTNYSISFSRAVSAQSDSSDSDRWDTAFSSIELTLWSVILSFLVLVVFVVMMIRMEQHLRRLSQQGQPPQG